MDLSLEQRTAPQFGQLLRGFAIDELERCESAAYGLTSDLTLGYMNPAWFRFARDNGGHDIHRRWGLGADVLRAIGSSLQPFFEQHLRCCLADRATWEHDYECSSAALFRQFHMNVFAIADGQGLLVVNALVVEAPHDAADRPACAPLVHRYQQQDGTILQCIHCRRVQRADGSEQWDWVPAFVEAMPDNMTGGLCKPCYRVHYPSAPAMP